MSWCGHETTWRNEHLFVGPHKLMATAQQEINDLGRASPPWSVHGWEFNAKGEVIILMVRGVQVNPEENA